MSLSLTSVTRVTDTIAVGAAFLKETYIANHQSSIANRKSQIVNHQSSI